MAATVTGSGRREPIVGPLLFPSGVLSSHDAIREGPAHLTKVYALGCREGYSRKVTYLQWVARQPPAGPLHTCPPQLSPNHCLSSRVVPDPSRIRAGAPKVREPRSNRARRLGPSGSQRQRPALHGLVDRVLPLLELPGRES